MPVLKLPMSPTDPSNTKLLLSLQLLSWRVGLREIRLSRLRAEVHLALLRRRSVGNGLSGGGHREVKSERRTRERVRRAETGRKCRDLKKKGGGAEARGEKAPRCLSLEAITRNQGPAAVTVIQ